MEPRQKKTIQGWKFSVAFAFSCYSILLPVARLCYLVHLEEKFMWIIVCCVRILLALVANALFIAEENGIVSKLGYALVVIVGLFNALIVEGTVLDLTDKFGVKLFALTDIALYIIVAIGFLYMFIWRPPKLRENRLTAEGARLFNGEGVVIIKTDIPPQASTGSSFVGLQLPPGKKL